MENPDTLVQKARRALEWPAIIEILASQAVSGLGAELCRNLVLADSWEATQESLKETAEMAALEASGQGLPLASIPDIRSTVARASKGAALTAIDLQAISTVLGAVSDLSRYLRARREEAPQIYAIAASLDGLIPLKQSIDRCVDADGSIRESATPDLRSLTHESNGLKQKIRRRLEAMLGSARFADLLQESYFAQRENRYVLPIKSERKGEVPGIVHDVSASGATVFIEPRELVDLNNQIKEADLAVEREVRRILQRLSDEIRLHHQSLLNNVDTIGRLDCLRAKAMLAKLLDASDPLLNNEGRIRLAQARHPLLILHRKMLYPAADSEKENAVPVVPEARLLPTSIVANDIELGQEARVLIISGPNTGGKTVTLKIVGLFALMVRGGLQLPCDPGSEMAFFPEVFAEIGDAQDLKKDLSSFSAQMRDMIAILRESTSQSLVLLDEPVTSTDPTEGAALAQALLIHLAERGATVVATTHYNPLKALAQEHPGFASASVGFNPVTLSPTYRLISGMPGGSSAIDIAGRLGMDEKILDEAVRLLTSQERAVGRLMEDLQQVRQKVEDDMRRIAELRVEVETAAKTQKELAARQALTEKEARQVMRKKLTEELHQARTDVRAVVEALKNDKRLVKAREAKERLAQMEQSIRARVMPPDDYRPLQGLQAGDRVELLDLGTVGILSESPSDKKRVRVRVGEIEVSVATSSLAGLPEDWIRAEPQRPSPAPGSGPAGYAGGVGRDRSSLSTVSTVLDVRGQTAEDALETLRSFLDRAALNEASPLRVVHGHGSGRLKQVLRLYLKESPYVASFRPGDRAEGGDGVTVITLR
jgi:DNA mismatch repair protein MutS2